MISVDDPLDPDELEAVLTAVISQAGNFFSHQASTRIAYEGADYQDYLQTAWLRIMEHPPNAVVELGQDCMPYIITMVYNANRNARRDYLTHQKILKSGVLVPWLSGYLSCTDPETIYLEKEAYRECLAQVRSMTPALAEVGLLMDEGLSPAEIQAELGITRHAYNLRVLKLRKRILAEEETIRAS